MAAGSQKHVDTERDDPPPPSDRVRDALERILDSPDFGASERRRAFLCYVVEETLSGRDDRLKGYAIATAFFGLPEDFDPQMDPVVRLESGRLRRDLDSYYAGVGRHDPLRISIPKGAYVPRFERSAPTSLSSSPSDEAPDLAPLPAEAPGASPDPAGSGAGRRRRWYVPVALLVLRGLAVGGWTALGRGSDRDVALHGPAVALLPFRPLVSSNESAYLAAGLGEILTRDLLRFPGFRLFLPTEGSDATLLETLPEVDYLIEGSVRAEEKTFRIAVRLREPSQGRVLWSNVWDRSPEPGELIGLESELAEEISAALGQPYGPVAEDLTARAQHAAVQSMASYLCVLRAFEYRRTFSKDAAGPVLACLEEAVKDDPEYSDAWAMLGWLHMDKGRFGWDADPTPEYAKAVAAAQHALDLDPNGILALSVRSASRTTRATTISVSGSGARPLRSTRMIPRSWPSSAGGSPSAGTSTRGCHCSNGPSPGPPTRRHGTTR